MDKSRKLRRYHRKDYSQMVDFPVEIVGRDGVVRRYSFEESIRLYQRRIASAVSRYTDADVALAEAEHCRRRIEQLRRSYLARYGWDWIQQADVGVGELAGELVAFLRRCLEGEAVDLSMLSLSRLEEAEHHQIFFARLHPPDADDGAGEEEAPGGGGRYLLYVYRFRDAEGGAEREAFFRFLGALRSVSVGGDLVEGLIAFHHSADCGLILTGSGGGRAGAEVGAGGLLGAASAEIEPGVSTVRSLDPLQEGMILLGRGDRAGAHRRFVAAYEANHYRRAAYIGASVVADQLGEYADAETAALMGSRYFPEEPMLGVLLAISRLRRGEGRAAREALSRAEREGDAQQGALPYLLLEALIALQQGQVARGRRRLRQARRLARRETEGGPARALYRVRALLAARDLLVLGAVSLLWGAALLAWLWSGWFLLLCLACAALLPAIHAAWRRQLTRLLSASGPDGLVLIDGEALQRALSDAPIPL